MESPSVTGSWAVLRLRLSIARWERTFTPTRRKVKTKRIAFSNLKTVLWVWSKTVGDGVAGWTIASRFTAPRVSPLPIFIWATRSRRTAKMVLVMRWKRRRAQRDGPIRFLKNYGTTVSPRRWRTLRVAFVAESSPNLQEKMG